MSPTFPLILSQLTPTEMRLFRQAGLTYTSSTGDDTKGYPDGPYIATFVSELIQALRVMGWTHANLKLGASELIVRRA